MSCFRESGESVKSDTCSMDLVKAFENLVRQEVDEVYEHGFPYRRKSVASAR